jgi:hypothetical protein
MVQVIPLCSFPQKGYQLPNISIVRWRCNKTLHCHGWNHTICIIFSMEHFHFPIKCGVTEWRPVTVPLQMCYFLTCRLTWYLIDSWPARLCDGVCSLSEGYTWLQGSICHSSQGSKLQLKLTGGGIPARNWQWNGLRFRWWSRLSTHWISRILKPPLQFREHCMETKSKGDTWILTSGLYFPSPWNLQAPNMNRG